MNTALTPEANRFSTRPTFVPMDPESMTSFDRLLDDLRALADSERMKGNYLEQLAKHFLALEPLWADQLGSVWLWNEWPDRRGRPDTGIDIVAEIQGGGLLAVQVKFFKESHKIEKKDLDSFFEAMGKEPFTEGLVIDTTAGLWSTHAEEALRNRTKPVRRVSLDELRHCAVDWSTYTLKYPAKAPKRHSRKTERPHQRQAISAVIDGFTGVGGRSIVDRGKLIMACGTGKTFTSLKLAERWTRDHNGGVSTILFMVPSLALLQQSLNEWSAERDPELDFQAFAVGSDINIGRTRNDDLTSVMLEDLGAPATTDGKRLAELLERREAVDEGMTVVFSTYQSIDAIATSQKLGAPAFDLIICDEAHRTTGAVLPGDDESHFVKIHDDGYVSGHKRVYMTATPRIFAPEVKNLASQKDAELISMDDETLFGPELYRIGFDEAVRAQLLTDYKVIVLGVSEDQIVEGFQRELADDGHELQIGDVAKLIGCYNALAKRNAGQLADGFGSDLQPMRRAVAFAKDIKTSEGIANDFETLVDGQLANIMNDDPSDDLTVQARHIDGTMNATKRGALLDWLKADAVTDPYNRPVARVLTNARCLSEGVDVPNLDAVLFLHPRNSQVDVVQAVGRVMRRAEGKRLGYIVLPIAIPAGVEPEEALNDNNRYRVVWQVLQALRAHDERLDTAINQAALTGIPPEQITVLRLNIATKKGPDGHGIGAGGSGGDDAPESGEAQPTKLITQPALFALADASKWKDAVYAKLVAKVGDRMYWDDWAGDIAVIAQRFIALIRAHLESPESDRAPFEIFVEALRATVNPEVSLDEAIEMLAQHLITKPVFEAMFPDSSFSQVNPVSVALESVIDTFHDNAAFEREREPLDLFYVRVTDRIRRLPTVHAKQELLRTLYDKFFTKAFPLLADKMGIVFTPIEVVDYILRSADDLSRSRFGKGLSDEGVNVIDPFVGTGTFLTRLLQTGLVRPADLSRKYSRELFANEIVLLSYYIAAVNIESVYREVCAENSVEPEAGGFQGISLTDTFAMDERDNELGGNVFPENTARLEKQRSMPINVVVMNPPYRAGQASANDDSKNAKYPKIDAAIKNSYVARSSGSRKADLYDSYYRAIRWATGRIGDAGIIAFVSNSGFLEGGTAAGVRLSWADEFSEIVVYNLRGNQRKKDWKAEGGKVFGEGSQTGVAITMLVKDPHHEGPARIHYRDIGDSLSREEKLERLAKEASIEGTEFGHVIPNDEGDWINHRDERFGAFQALGDKTTKGKADTPGIFRAFALGASTNRDAWVYNFGRSALRANVGRMIDEFAEHIHDPHRKVDGSRIGWSSGLDTQLRRRKKLDVADGTIRRVNYRPFVPINLWYDPAMIDRLGISERLAPTDAHKNLAIAVTTDSRKPSPPFIARGLVDLNFTWSTQVFPRYIWEPTSLPDGGINLDALEDSSDIIDGYRRLDNITDATLERYRAAYGGEVNKDDIFFSAYALLHHPSYRDTFASDLTKMLPRIPLVENFSEYVRLGRELADLHLNYETAPGHPDVREDWALSTPEELVSRFEVTKPAWVSRKDRTRLRYNEHLTLVGIPEEEALYKVGGRSPLEWVIDRYNVKADTSSGIVNDPNDWLTEQERPSYLVDLIRSLVTVSLETQRLVSELPNFTVTETK